MNTPTNLPFIPDPNYDHILNDDDRKNFAPKLATDEFWSCLNRWERVMPDDEFACESYYRRRKSSGWVSVEAAKPDLNAPILASDGYVLYAYKDGIKDYDLFKRWKLTHWQPWTLPALPQPPKPAAEVACKEWQKTTGWKFSQGGVDVLLKAYLAGVAWAKDHKEAL